ncbi:MAG: ATP-binding cassette domain-containing protein, partial [Asticcacaulis sp.]
ILIGLAALFSPVCAVILAGAFVPFILIMAVIGLGTRDAARRQFETLSRLSALFYDRLAALPLLSAFEAGPHQTKQVGTATRAVSASTLSVLRIAFINAAVLEFFAALSVALVAVYCGFSLLTLLPFPVPETLTFAEAFACLALAPEVYAPLRRLSAAYHDKEVAEAADIALSPLQEAPPVAPSLKLTVPPEIVFDAWCLGFDDDPQAQIGPLSATVRSGGLLALTGPSGSGKTALLRTLIGHGRMTSGRLIVNAEVFTRAPDLSADIAYIGQTTPVLSQSLRDNLTLGQPVTETALQEALTLCGLLPLWQARGGDTLLSADRHGLSGGEARRVGWVRALLKPAVLLILDEPTADLDPAAAEDFVRVLNRLRQGRTSLLATHDPRLAALADVCVSLTPERGQ